MADYEHRPKKYFEDMNILQCIFPEEIWYKIFNHLSDVGDYHQVGAASTYLYHLILPHGLRVLFPDVVKALLKAIDLPNDLPASLLRCRLVCRKWKQGLDDVFQQIAERSFPVGKKLIRLHRNVNRTLYFTQHKFELTSKIDKFLQTFDEYHYLPGSNPFPSRSVYIFNSFQNGYSSFYNKMEKLLQKYGHHLWHCIIVMWNCRTSITSLIDLLANLLQHMPNLKSLSIHIDRFEYFNFNESASYLECILFENPIPKLRNLELFNERGLPPQVFNCIIKNNPGITKLTIHRLDFESHYLELFQKPVLKLQELQISKFNHFGGFMQLQTGQVIWPLKKLKIDFVDVNPRILNLVKTRWAETLTDLDLTFPHSGVPKRFRTCLLELPHLENLTLTIRNYDSIDFILPMSKSLVSLYIRVLRIFGCSKSVEDKDTIQFFAYRNDLHKSNIWEHFPKLRELWYYDENMHRTFRVHEYRRNHWVGYNKNQMKYH